MAFRKFAKVEALGGFEFDAEGTVTKTASAGDTNRSYYLDGSSKIDIRGLLERVASKYSISADPQDYLFEAIRANTVNVPNENHDGFHKDELLRYDARLDSAVYLTYRSKPHHVNHRTDNPKTARGVIVDAHYNDETPALDHCPTCNTKTAERNNRDASGIHCAKCGTTVKDEFVEILLAVDTKKDPIFAEGVRTGQLRAGSMGCNCATTFCNVCGNVARSRNEFCKHIRTGSKGTLWAKSGGDWTKINRSEAEREFRRRGSKFNPGDMVAQRAPDGFEVRKAFEYCQGVEFDEYSRVDQPADPKALQQEILGKAAHAVDFEVSPEELQMESEQMIARAKRRAKAAGRTAAKFHVVRVDGDDQDTYAAPTLDEAVELAQPDDGSTLEHTEVEALDAGMARLKAGDAATWQPLNSMEQSGDADMSQSIEDFTEDQLAPNEGFGEDDETYSPEEMGVIPPGASKESSMRTLAEAYSGWEVLVSPSGNAMLVNPKEEPVLVFTASAQPKNDDDRRAFGVSILNNLREDGLLRTAKKFKGLYHAKFANVVDHAADDMREFEDKQLMPNVASEGEDDMAHDRDRGEHANDVRDDRHTDMEEPAEADSTDTRSDRATDMEAQDDNAPDSALSGGDDDLRDVERQDKSVGDGVHEDGMNDRAASLLGKRVAAKGEPDTNDWLVASYSKKANKFVLTNRDLETREVAQDELLNKWRSIDTSREATKQLEARLKKVYAAKVEELKKAHAEALENARKEATADYTRALRVAAARMKLDLYNEASPLKTELGEVLCNEKVAGHDSISGQPLVYDQPLPPDLAVHLIEAAWHEGADREIDMLVNKAAELMSRDSEYLKSAEADLSKTAHKIPPITAASMIDHVENEAEALRREASRGNLELTSNGSESDPVSTADTRSKIQAALGGTRLSSRSSQYR